MNRLSHLALFAASVAGLGSISNGAIYNATAPAGISYATASSVVDLVAGDNGIANYTAFLSFTLPAGFLADAGNVMSATLTLEGTDVTGLANTSIEMALNGTQDVNQSGSVLGSIPGTLTFAAVDVTSAGQTWQDNPSDNYGFILRPFSPAPNVSQSFSIGSATLQLVTEVTAAPEPATMLSLIGIGGLLTMRRRASTR